MSKKVLEIVRGIAQAAADIGYDGAVNENGDPVKIGLKREEGHVINDSRRMDGFNVGISGKTLILSYHTDMTLKEVYSQDLESEIGSMMSKIISELKKRYKANTGKSLTLKKEGEVDVRVESSSRIRCWATARCLYNIGNLGETLDIKSDEPPQLEKTFKSFLDKGGFGKRPENPNQS